LSGGAVSSCEGSDGLGEASSSRERMESRELIRMSHCREVYRIGSRRGRNMGRRSRSRLREQENDVGGGVLLGMNWYHLLPGLSVWRMSFPAQGYPCAWNKSWIMCIREGVRASGLQHLHGRYTMITSNVSLLFYMYQDFMMEAPSSMHNIAPFPLYPRGTPACSGQMLADS